MSRPSLPSDDFPSSLATRSSGSLTRSRVEPRTNSPGCRMKGSSITDLHELREVLLVGLHVDERVARVPEHAKQAVDADVEARRLHQRRVVRAMPIRPASIRRRMARSESTIEADRRLPHSVDASLDRLHSGSGVHAVSLARPERALCGVREATRARSGAAGSPRQTEWVQG